MSDSLIAWKPRIEEPSKPRPSSAKSAVNSPIGTEKCWDEPIKSGKRTSTTSAPAAFALRVTSAKLLEATPAVAVVLAFAIETSIQSRVPAGRPSAGLARALNLPVRVVGERLHGLGWFLLVAWSQARGRRIHVMRTNENFGSFDQMRAQRPVRPPGSAASAGAGLVLSSSLRRHSSSHSNLSYT